MKKAAGKSLDLALVNMPFAAVTSPSIQLGVLHAAAAQAGFRVRTFHFNLELLRFLDARSDAEQRARNLRFITDATHRFSELHPFAMATAPLFDDGTVPWPEPAIHAHDPAHVQAAVFVRRLFPEFIDHCARLLLAHDPVAVGLSCAFDRLPQLQLARRLKDLRPSIWTVFGGAYMDGVMGEALARVFRFVDIVVRGEGETPLVEVLEDLRSGHVRPHDGLVWRERDEAPEPLVMPEVPSEPGRLLSPTPDYDDYFEQIVGTAAGTNRDIRLPIETSRGCQWFRHKCLFCGRSEDALRYRPKSSDRIRDELEFLSARHQVLGFLCVDPCVNEKQLAHVADRARHSGHDYRLWCQGRVFIDRERYRPIASLVDTMYLGIESFSTPLLRLMRKGHTALQALVALKRGVESGLALTYQLLHGFPGEREEHYVRMNDWLPSFCHLPPPLKLWPLAIDRGSVFFDRAMDFGITLRPVSAERDPVQRLAESAGASQEQLWDLGARLPADIPCVTGEVIETTRALVAAWIKGYADNANRLWWERGPSFLVIHDERAGATRAFELPSPLDHVYMATDEGATVEDIERHLAGADVAMKRSEIESTLAELVDERLMYEEDGRFLSLAVRVRAP